jgi:hypothetical protein
MVSKKGKLRSYHSFVNNAHLKLNSSFIGMTMHVKNIDGSESDIKITKTIYKEHLKNMNRLQGKSSESKFVKSYLKSKNWHKVNIKENSSRNDIRKALKNQKIYNESKARYMVYTAKKKGSKMTLKFARQQVNGMLEKYEGVGGSW